jgi:cell division cycle 14
MFKVPVFRSANIGLVIRLNKKQYDRRRFTENGIKHMDLYFLDGSCPSREIINKFLYLVREINILSASTC